jgi:cephalosporin hydroxylase
VTIDAIHAEYNTRLHQWSDIQDHLPYIHVAAQKSRYPTIIEIGVRTGFSTCALLSGAHYMRGQVWSCDVNEPDVPGPWHADPRWHFKKGSSVSEEVLDWMPPRADLIMIDSGHDQELTLQELRAYHPRLRGEGVVLMHDTQFMPPNLWLSEVGGPVYDAIVQFTAETGAPWYNRKSPEPFYGLGVIARVK